MHMKRVYVALLFLAVVLAGSLVGAQESSEIITITGFYIQYSGEYENVLLPCQSSEAWDLATDSPAFSPLSQQYTSLEQSGQLGKYRELFVELRGHYRAYADPIHADGSFEITEVVRHSTAAVDPTVCPLECEDIHGADAPTCLAQIDGQCGPTRNSCVAGSLFFYRDMHSSGDTAAHYRWECAGIFGGDNAVCTAPKATTPPTLRGEVDGVSRLQSGPLTLYGWAYDTVAPTATIPVEIYVGGAQGTGTLAATVTADQPQADVNAVLGIRGGHGFTWPVPAQYQSSAQEFYMYAVDQTPNPTVRRQLSNSPLTLLAPGAEGYCAQHGPCEANQGGCTGNETRWSGCSAA